LPASRSVENLVADAAMRNDLLIAIRRFRADAANTPGYGAIPPSAVAGISPGSLFYAFDRSSSTYWARASFYPKVAASRTFAAVGFQDGGADGIFTRPSGRAWLVESVGPCHSGLPVRVARIWSLQNPTICSSRASIEPTSTTATISRTPGVSPTCPSDWLSGSAYQGSGAGGHEEVIVVLTNRASSACVLRGYPTARFVDASGQRLSATYVQEATPPPSTVRVLPGGHASTTIWTSNPEVPSGSYCQPTRATGVVVAPPGQTSEIPATVVMTVCSRR
jgi:hypothetical protein